MAAVWFDGEKFINTLDGVRQARNMTWRKVADEAGVSASTLTRLSHGKRPDVDSLGALARWAGVGTDGFFLDHEIPRSAEPVAQAMGYLRADPNLDAEGAEALAAILKVAYDNFRKA
ncbi:helix-turn-helix domain-containing protein [Novosphingopyxis sp.]|uniref:helix-turn-helix domain-containing protein n=1 Tax=Novosphingopyxis sp. TaxID=2709690 RepID=UPI003B5A8741